MAWYSPLSGAYPNHGEPFADILRFVETGHAGAGVDTQGPPFAQSYFFGGPGAWTARDRGARRAAAARHREAGEQQQGTPTPPRDGEKTNDADPAQDPPEVAPEDNPEQTRPCGARSGGCRGGRRAHFHHGRGRASFPLDPAFFIRAMSNHPLAQGLRDWAEQAADESSSSSGDTFAPPLDIFSNEREFVLHLALPGAKKEDIGVNWDADKSELSIAGVVHRAGDEEFLKGLVSSERRVGVFERKVKLPPRGAGADSKDEVDGLGITAKMEDGVLIVVVPKVEKEWTEVRKVDIE